MLFNQAEAMACGWIKGDAEELHRAAITASMNQVGVAYDVANFTKSIGEQKWVVLYFQGIEGWSEYRRLGYPALKAGPAAILIKEVQRRRAYTTTEFSLNRTNYTAAIDRQFGGDDGLGGRV